MTDPHIGFVAFAQVSTHPKWMRALDRLNVDEGVTATQPAYPLRPEKVSDRLMAHIGDWQAACREILTTGYRYPSKPKKESPLGHGTVRHMARRGIGVPFSVVATIMGWSPSTTVRMARRYGHIGQTAQRLAVNALKGGDFGGDGPQNWAQSQTARVRQLAN